MSRLPKFASLALWAFAARVAAQAVPADVGTGTPGIGFSLPRVGGTLSYALTGSEFISTGFYGDGVSAATNLSGDMAYVSRSQRHPFSAVYAGGIMVANHNQPTTVYQSLSASQVLNTRNWNITVGDSVSYLPESPVGGLSGVAGAGDLGVDPVSVGSAAGLGILTNYGPRVTNTASGTIGRQLTQRWSAQATGAFNVQEFIGDNSQLGLNSTSVSASAGVSYHFSARDTVTGNYNYSEFSYSGSPYSFNVQGATGEYSRQWSARLVTDVYAGPQFVGGSDPAVSSSSVSLAAGASASYLSHGTSFALSFARGVNNGSGVIPGSLSDSVSFTAHRKLGEMWSASADVGYSNASSLPNFRLYQFHSSGVFAGGQLSRALGRVFSTFLSYTVEDQSVSTTNDVAVAPNAFTGAFQSFSIGVTYSPRSIPIGR